MSLYPCPECGGRLDKFPVGGCTYPHVDPKPAERISPEELERKLNEPSGIDQDVIDAHLYEPAPSSGEVNVWYATEFRDDNGLFFKQVSKLEPVDRGQWILPLIEKSAYDAVVKERDELARCFKEIDGESVHSLKFESDQLKEKVRELEAELKIQDDANDILTRRCEELKLEVSRLREKP